MKIHKEGFKMIPLMAALIGGLYSLLYWWIPFFIVQVVLAVAGMIFFILVVRFFRDPEVITPEKDGVVYAPAEGKVVVIEPTEEHEYFKGKERLQISIFMSPLNVHVNRNPVTGLIKYFQYHPGKYLVAWHPKSSTENERTTLVYEVHKGVEILVRQIAGAVARRIKWYVEANQSVIQGKEFGFIKFGSRVDLFLPLDAEVKVKPGDKVKGGRSVLAELVK